MNEILRFIYGVIISSAGGMLIIAGLLGFALDVIPIALTVVSVVFFPLVFFIVLLRLFRKDRFKMSGVLLGVMPTVIFILYFLGAVYVFSKFPVGI